MALGGPAGGPQPTAARASHVDTPRAQGSWAQPGGTLDTHRGSQRSGGINPSWFHCSLGGGGGEDRKCKSLWSVVSRAAGAKMPRGSLTGCRAFLSNQIEHTHPHLGSGASTGSI